MRSPFRFLGSIKVAVPLLVSIAGVLAWGTLYEARFGTASVQRFVYGSWWFQGLLGFLAVNLATAAFLRYPWKRKHIPFVLAHIGIILILTGGILGGRFGQEGQLIIPEGSSSNSLQTNRNVLAIRQPNPGIHVELATHFETTAWNHVPHALFELPLEQGPLQLVVDRYYPNAERRKEVVDGGEQENPAVHLSLSYQDKEQSAWLWARDPNRFGAVWGQAHLLFLQMDSAQLKKLISQKKTGLPPNGIALIHLLPERRPALAEAPPRASAQRLMAVLTDSKGKREKIGPLVLGQSTLHPQLGYQFTVSALYLHAREEESFANRDDEVRAEALHLVARQGDRTAQAWLGLRETAVLPFGKHPVLVEYRPAVRAVPFSVRLIDFRKTDYPGTEMAASFESDVELSDPSRGVTFKKRISMNNPLKYRGYSLFQSSYIQGPTETTVLSVRNDPGTPLVYSGFLIVLAGVITLFTSRTRST